MKAFQIILCSLLVSISGIIRAQVAGTLDATFGVGGIMTTPIKIKAGGGYLNISREIEQPDRKMIVLFDKGFYDTVTQNSIDTFMIARFSTDGTIDEGFGNKGFIPIDYSVSSMLLLPDGKMVLVGYAAGEAGLYRYLPNGTPDMEFGTAGYLGTGIFVYPSDASLSPSGKILITGSVIGRTLIAQLEPDGSRTPGFGTDGIVLVDYDSVNYENASKIMGLNDGKIIVTGLIYNNYAFATVMRLLPDGQLDPSFSGDGKMRMNYASFYPNYAMIEGDGKLVIGGRYYTNNFTKTVPLIYRIKTNGNPDSTFGSYGAKVTNLGGNNDNSNAVLVQPNGKLISAGANDSKLALMRLNNDGSYDVSFNATGKNIMSFLGGYFTPSFVQLLPDGKIMVHGVTGVDATTAGYAMARFYTGINMGVLDENKPKDVLVYPNPVQQDVSISYTLNQPSTVTFSLIDLHGKQVAEFAKGMQNSGEQNEMIHLGSDVVEGVYFLRVSAGNASKTIKMLVER